MAWWAEALAPLKGEPVERMFLGLDTEDDQLGYGPGRGFYLGCVTTPEGSATFTSKKRLMSYLFRARWSGYWVACHNLEYDALNVFGPGGVCRMDPCFSGSRLCGLRVKVDPGKGPRSGYLTFFDTAAFLAEPLAALAPLVGLKKLEARHRPGDRRVTPGRVEYCRRDAEIVRAVAGFVQEGIRALGGQMRLTAAATALDLYRRRYQSEALPCLPEPVQETMLQGYSGGRVEAFRLGDFRGRLYGNDFNGMYVSVMADARLPELGTLSRRPKEDLAREGMAHAEMSVPEHLWAAPLPVKGDKLTFPVGRLRGWWTYSEIRLALNAGCSIRRLLEAWHSDRQEPYLRDMSLALRDIRERPETPAPVSRMAKLLGNSLYGKFAQRNEQYEYMGTGEFAHRLLHGTLGEYDRERTMEYPAMRLVRVVRAGAGFPRHSNVIWSACITAGARGRLYPHLDPDTTYYCDTDSVLGRRRYPETRALGSLALKERYRRLVIRGNKLYAGETADGTWEAHAKGVPRVEARRAVLEPGARIESRRPVKLRTALRGREPANRWVEVFKELSGDYDKRTVERDGETRPLEVRQW